MKSLSYKHGRVLVLRDWLEEDLEELKKWFVVGQKWQDFDGPYYKRTQEGFDAQIESIKKQIEMNQSSSPRERLVICDKASNTFIGTVGCYWESIETNWLCAGITIYDPDYWGKGFGHEALGLWVEYLFENYKNIIRLDLRTWSGNKGLIKIAHKIGFVEEARFRKARIVNGKYYDSIGLGILKTEFQEKYPNGFSPN